MYLHLSTIITSYEVFIISPYFVLTPEKIQEHIRQSYIAIFRAFCAGVRYRSFKLPTLSFFSNFKQFMNLFQLDILLTLDLNKILSIFMTKGNLSKPGLERCFRIALRYMIVLICLKTTEDRASIKTITSLIEVNWWVKEQHARLLWKTDYFLFL